MDQLLQTEGNIFLHFLFVSATSACVLSQSADHDFFTPAPAPSPPLISRAWHWAVLPTDGMFGRTSQKGAG